MFLASLMAVGSSFQDSMLYSLLKILSLKRLEFASSKASELFVNLLIIITFPVNLPLCFTSDNTVVRQLIQDQTLSVYTLCVSPVLFLELPVLHTK